MTTRQNLLKAARLVVAFLISVYGVLTQANSHLHLSPFVSGVLASAFPILLAIQHYLSDPSTGNTAAVLKAVGAQPDVAKVEALVRSELAKIFAAVSQQPTAVTRPVPVATPAPAPATTAPAAK